MIQEPIASAIFRSFYDDGALSMLRSRQALALVAMKIETTPVLRICSWADGANPYSIDSSLEDEEYEFVDMQLNPLQTGSPVEFVLPNADSRFSTIELSGGAFAGAAVTYMEFGRLNTLTGWTLLRVLPLEVGKLQWDAADFKFELKTGLYRKRKAALSIEDRACSNVYKDANCQSTSGDTTCTGTRDDCISKGNLQHFRGHPKARTPENPLTVRGLVVRVAPSGGFRQQPVGGGDDPPERPPFSPFNLPFAIQRPGSSAGTGADDPSPPPPGGPTTNTTATAS